LRFFTSSTSAIVAPICRWSAILASVSVVDIGHWRGLSVLNVSHRCGCHRPRRWPLLQLQSSPISFSTLAIVVVVAVINVGHHCGRCRRQHQLVHLQSHCCYWRVVHILVKLIVISIDRNCDVFPIVEYYIKTDDGQTLNWDMYHLYFNKNLLWEIRNRFRRFRTELRLKERIVSYLSCESFFYLWIILAKTFSEKSFQTLSDSGCPCGHFALTA
jgi:hypothetical protein